MICDDCVLLVLRLFRYWNFAFEVFKKDLNAKFHKIHVRIKKHMINSTKIIFIFSTLLTLNEKKQRHFMLLTFFVFMF